MTTPAPRPIATATIDKLIERVNNLELAGIALATAAELTGHGFMQMGSHIDALAARVTALETAPAPDEYQARLTLNTAQARIRHQADPPTDEAKS